MSRQVSGEYVLSGELVTRSALAIGSGSAGAATDMACVRDGLGRLIIPGSTLAGALRARFEDRQAWGTMDAASHLYIEDCPENRETSADSAAARPDTEIRDGVGIDRKTGSAAQGVLFSRDVVPKGSRFKLELRIEATVSDKGAVPREEAESLIKEVANVLTTGVSFGAATSTGLGSVRLEEGTLQWRHTGSRDELLDLLATGTAITVEAAPDEPWKPTGNEKRHNTLQITIPWSPLSPLLVSVASNGLVDRIPLTTTAPDGSVRLVIPGRSIKGALRSRVERIVRTLRSADDPGDAFISQMTQDLGPVQRLFGRPPQGEKEGRRAAVEVSEVYSDPDSNWGDGVRWDAVRAALAERMPPRAEQSNDAGRRQAEKLAPRAAANKKLRSSPIRINDHVAISRWTGGADDGKLFAVAAPEPCLGWKPLVLNIDLSRLGSDDQEVASALMALAFVLRDFAEGWIGIGYGTTRGYGEVTADPSCIEWCAYEPTLKCLEHLTSLNDLFVLPAGEGQNVLQETLLSAWSAEMEKTTEEAKA